MSEHDTHSQPEHGEHGHGHGDEPPASATPDIHGMLVVGEQAIFLSHLPMFGHPHHDIQAILPARFTHDEADSESNYVTDRRRSGERLYTLEPERFVLTELDHHAPGEACFCQFQGMVYRGHFERDGTELPPAVTVTVDRVIHFRKLDPGQAPLTELTYILFGAGDEHFLAHLITRPPDFDQVVSVTLAPGAITDAELSLGPAVTVPGRSNDIKHRLRAGEHMTVVLAGTGTEIELTVKTELYLEEGELGVTFSQKTTPEERAAGF